MKPTKLTAAADMNVTPLIDVLLVLLIIFMAALPLTQKGVDVNVPPDVLPRERQAPPAQIVVEYTAARQISINQQSVTLAALEERLRALFSSRTDKTLFIIGDPSVRYGEIVNIIDAGKGAGVDKVGIVTMGMREAGRSRE